MKNPYQLLCRAIRTALRRTRYFRREIKYRFHMRCWFPLRVQKTKAQFTVLTTVYNDVQHLDGFFTNLINQRVDFRNNLKVVVVVRRSTDGSAELVGKWRESYPESITLLHEPDRTYLEAINKGLAWVRHGDVYRRSRPYRPPVFLSSGQSHKPAEQNTQSILRLFYESEAL